MPSHTDNQSAPSILQLTAALEQSSLAPSSTVEQRHTYRLHAVVCDMPFLAIPLVGVKRFP